MKNLFRQRKIDYNFGDFEPTYLQVNGSEIKSVLYDQLLSKNLHSVGCASLCSKSEVMLFTVLIENDSNTYDKVHNGRKGAIDYQGHFFKQMGPDIMCKYAKA